MKTLSIQALIDLYKTRYSTLVYYTKVYQYTDLIIQEYTGIPK